MKIIKKILITVITNILPLLITFLTFCLNFEHIITDDILNNLIKEEVTNQTVEIFKNELGNVQDEELSIVKEKINNNEKIDNIIDKYVEQSISILVDDDNTSSIDFKEDFKTIIIENKDILEDEFNITISDQKLNKIIEDVDQDLNLNNKYNEAISQAKAGLSYQEKELLVIYNMFVSKELIIGLVVAILIGILLIALLKKSVYKWLFNLSISLFVASFLTLIASGVFGLIVNLALERINGSIQVNVTSLFISCLVMLISAIVLLIVYFIIKKTKEKDLVEEYE